MAEEKKSSSLPVLIILILLILGGAAGYVTMTEDGKKLLEPMGALQETQQDYNEAKDNDQMAEATQETAAPKIEMITELAPLEDMLRERVLGFTGGDRIKIVEHSSFTCSHCGEFHREAFPQLKQEYLMTGKAYLVMSDFPLNGPALYASMVSRCIPEVAYYDFVQKLFDDQKNWAYSTNYLDYLKATSQEFGLPENLYNQCINNDELRQGLLSKMQQRQTESDVRATPTFVINDIGQIKGALPYVQFKQAIEAAVAPAPKMEPAATNEASE